MEAPGIGPTRALLIAWGMLFAVVIMVVMSEPGHTEPPDIGRIYSDARIHCMADNPFLDDASASCYSWHYAGDGNRYWNITIDANCEWRYTSFPTIPAACWDDTWGDA